ncbi:MAG: hypothetical protein NC827_10035, partial [Candidatus Omnitrophica bacterium]|nr:hypothetical protein [Candidatus Omnitrophota bacterium]
MLTAPFLFLSYIIPFLLTIFIGSIILIRNFRNKANILFALITFIVGFWILCLAIADFSHNYSIAFLWSKLAITGPIFLPLLLIYFFLNFPITLKVPKWTKLLFIPTICLFGLAFTKYNIKEVKIQEWGVEVSPGILYPLFFVYFIIYLIIAILLLIKQYRKAGGIAKQQIKYIFLGCIISIILGLVTNVILVLLGISYLGIFGPGSTLFFLGFTALAITRYHLFGIEVILTEILVGVIGLLLIV